MRRAGTMANRKRPRIRFLWIVSVSLAVLAGISYLRSFHVRVPWGDARRFVGSIGDGNFRLVYFEVSPDSRHRQDARLDEYAEVWMMHPTDRFLFRSNAVLFWQTPVSYVVVGLTMFLPLVVLLGHRYLIRPVLKKRRQFAAALWEIIRPSDRHLVARPVRLLRRSALGVVTLVAFVIGGAWLLTFSPMAASFSKSFDSTHLRWVTYPGATKVEYGGHNRHADPFFSISVDATHVTAFRRSNVVQGNEVSTTDFGFAGFHWYQQVNPSRPTSDDVQRLGLVPRSSVTGELMQKVEVPWWAPIILFGAWPVVAFLRGPYRRARRRFDGLCLACGYNLTGLAGARCPECGTTVKP